MCHLWESCKWLWKRTLSNCYTLIWPSRNWPEAGLRSGAYSPADMRCATQLNLCNHTNTELSWVALITGCTMAWARKVTDCCYPEKARIGQGCGLIDLYHLSGPLYLSAWAGIQTLSRHSVLRMAFRAPTPAPRVHSSPHAPSQTVHFSLRDKDAHFVDYLQIQAINGVFWIPGRLVMSTIAHNNCNY